MFCKFITIGLGLVASLGLSNAALSQVTFTSLSELGLDNTNVVYAAIIGGNCESLSMASKDLTDLCTNVLMQVSYRDHMLMAIPFRDGSKVAYIKLMGDKSVQPTLNRYTLFLKAYQMSLSSEEKYVGATQLIDGVGTCEMFGNPDVENTTFECVFQQPETREEIRFKFVSDPNKTTVFH